MTASGPKADLGDTAEELNDSEAWMDLDRLPRRLNSDWCSELIAGGAPYFTVSYPEPGVNVPHVETLIYLGSTQIPDEDDGQLRTGFLFQNAQLHLEDGDWSTLPEAQRDELAAECAVMFYNEQTVGGIADIDGLLVLLGDLRERMQRGLGWERSLPEDK